MLSSMESSPEEQLAAAARGAAAPYVEYPPTPWWYAPTVGAWTAALVGTFTWWREDAVLFSVVMVALVAAEGVFLAWMRHRHGALPAPGMGTPPPEIAGEQRRYLAALPVMALVVGLTWWLVGIPAAAGVSFVLVTVGLVGYERRYARAAARTRARLP
jgi:hypothetical protein